jgi:formylglycine-generating enzyme required for sulfatase activity
MEFQMGSPGHEQHRDNWAEIPHRKRISRSFAIATKEVTVKQFLRFDPDFNYATTYSPELDCPTNSVNWWDAAKYCRWLSDQEKVPQDQMCYPPIEQIKEGLSLPVDHLEKTGYRLPTEAEWEFCCRAGTQTSRYYGNSSKLLHRYAWTANNSDYRLWPVGRLMPNDLGLFDILGNTMEWCAEKYRFYAPEAGGIPSEDGTDTAKILDYETRILRGGAFLYQPSTGRSAHRHRYLPYRREPNFGFRVVRTVPRAQNEPQIRPTEQSR